MRSTTRFPSLLLIVLLALFMHNHYCGAFLLPSKVRNSQGCKLNYNNNDEIDPISPMERLSMAGVSVSERPPGFFVLLEGSRGTVPLAVTCDPQDAYATTSPESLTIIQLLSGVDMAGAILPPETLAKLVVLHCESIPELFLDESKQSVLQMVHASLKKGRAAAANDQEDNSPLSFADAHPWLQSRTQLPQVTLDELVLSYVDNKDESGRWSSSPWQCTLKCNVKSIGTISLVATPDLIQAVSYNYDPSTSGLFISIALALRYKAPIVLEHAETIPYVASGEKLDTLFPQRTTVSRLRQSSTRVTQNIERGFEVHKLTKALEIARRLGDIQAEAKIRAELDRFDSFQELPITIDVPLEEMTEGVVLQNDDDDATFQ